MTLTEKIIEEFEKEFQLAIFFKESGKKEVKDFLLSSLHQVATEAIEAVRLEKNRAIPTSTTTDYPRIIMEEAGYNYAISEMEQKPRSF